MSTGSLARRYARALLELANEQRQVDRVKKELEELSAMWVSSTELRELFGNPQFGAQARKAALTEIITRAGVSPLVRNAVLYLADHGRILALADIARAFGELAEKAAGTVRAEVTSAAPLSESYYLQLQRALEQATGKRVAIERKTDASLIAGVVTKVGDQVFDGSVRTRLAELKETLKSA
jgi:F-type H+-transporting ATPase subunit delta